MSSLHSLLRSLCLLFLLLQFTNADRKQPNIILILTDDQDQKLQSLDYMPLLKKYIADQGTTFNKHYCTVSICCPSRVNLLTGRAAHNTNVTDVIPPFGGYPKFIAEGLNENNLPVWLQQAGYNTYYVGKYLNGHTLDNYNKPLAKGFTGSEFLLDPSTYQYYNASMSRNGGIPVNYPGQYSNDLVANKAYDFLDDAIAAGKPFFLGIAPIGPHSEFQFATLEASAPQYPPRHANLFNTITVPRTPNFNPSTPGGTSWISTLPPLTPEALAYGDTFYRARLRSLQSIDEMIESLTLRLNTKKLLENTYIIYTSDNGFHISQHRLPPGKNCGFEEDINIPLLIRGPGVSKGVSTQKVSSHTDIAPTIMSLALGKNGLDGHGFDGKPISLDIKEEGGSDSVNIEYWGRALPEGDFAAQLFYGNNTYKAVRIMGEGYSYYYAVWCTNERELYDMLADPYQLTNLALPIPSPNPVPSPSSTPRTPSPPS